MKLLKRDDAYFSDDDLDFSDWECFSTDYKAEIDECFTEGKILIKQKAMAFERGIRMLYRDNEQINRAISNYLDPLFAFEVDENQPISFSDESLLRNELSRIFSKSPFFFGVKEGVKYLTANLFPSLRWNLFPRGKRGFFERGGIEWKSATAFVIYSVIIRCILFTFGSFAHELPYKGYFLNTFIMGLAVGCAALFALFSLDEKKFSFFSTQRTIYLRVNCVIQFILYFIFALLYDNCFCPYGVEIVKEIPKWPYMILFILMGVMALYCHITTQRDKKKAVLA
jgi:hypothetical protein